MEKFCKRYDTLVCNQMNDIIEHVTVSNGHYDNLTIYLAAIKNNKLDIMDEKFIISGTTDFNTALEKYMCLYTFAYKTIFLDDIVHSRWDLTWNSIILQMSFFEIVTKNVNSTTMKLLVDYGFQPNNIFFKLFVLKSNVDMVDYLMVRYDFVPSNYTIIIIILKKMQIDDSILYSKCNSGCIKKI